VRLNFVFFTDSVSKLYGQGMYVHRFSSCYKRTERNSFVLYIIESSVGYELRIVFRHQKLELILYVGALMFQAVCAVFGSSRNAPRLLMSVFPIIFLLKNARNLFRSNVLNSSPTRSYLM
jgi:hypothetical protein